MRIAFRTVALAAAALSIAVTAPRAAAQEPGGGDLAALVERARTVNPDIAAARRAVDAARARAEAAGALPDPRLAAGLTNALVSDPLSSEDMMTMRTVQLGIVLPYPGKRGLERDAARHELAAAEADLAVVELRVVAEVKRAWYEVWLLGRALDVVRNHRALLDDFVDVTEARYGVGTGGQPDVLKAQVERTGLGDEILDLERRRAAAASELNALLDRPIDTPAPAGEYPEAVERAAIPPTGTEVRFTAAALGADGDRAGPVPDLATLRSAAEASNPRLEAMEARIAVRRAAARLADLAALPDFDVMVGYGQRSGREDMTTIMVAVPLPLFKGRKQDPLADAAEADVAALEAERRALSNEIGAEVATLREALIRTRERLALVREGVLPQARASLEASVAGYPVGSVDFLTLVDAQATLFRHELDYYELLADFGRDLAALERAVGGEVLR
ncbi:MAG TPA: TolC family protein [Gemmatimonadota bacterium]|nr:TolC family protein [Gemmatimonadota bacterium]